MLLPSASGIAESVDSVKTSQPTYRGTLRIGYMQQVDSLNPFVGLNDVSRVFYGLVYDCLQAVDEFGNVTPNLARSWYMVPTSDPEMDGMPYGSIWQYNLTRNASWSDGTPFTADDVVYTVELNLPSHIYYGWTVPEPYAYFMHQVWKLDNYTVRISFWDPATLDPIPAAYAYLLTIPMLPKHLMEQLSIAYIQMNWSGLFPESMSPGMPLVGTGPFIAPSGIYDDWVQGDHITLMRNPNYHQLATDGREVKFGNLTMKFFQDTASIVHALKNGDVDVAAFPPSAYQSIKHDVEIGALDSIQVFDGEKITRYWTYLGFCMNNAGPNPSRLDPIVRQALHMATNKNDIIEDYYLGLGDPGTTLIPPISSTWHYEPNTTEKAKFSYNLTAASSLLEANGYVDVDSDGIRECTNSSLAVQMGYVVEGTKMVYQMLVRKEYPEEKDIAMYLKDQWAEIGVDTTVYVVEELTLSQVAYSYAYDSLIWCWSGDIDPNHQLFVLSRAAWNGLSDCKYYNPAYDAAYTNSVMTTDPDQRETWVDEAQKIFYNDSAYIILSYVHQGYAWRTDTFSGWGDWYSRPARTIDNYWSANPLFFDLVSADGPITLSITAHPNPAKTHQTIDFNISAHSKLGRALSFSLDFGDGRTGKGQSFDATTGVQYVHITHSYSRSGNYTIIVTVDDKSDSPNHSVTAELVEWMIVEKGEENISLLLVLGGAALAAVGVAIAIAAYYLRRDKQQSAPPK